ncbi:hypothetical protein G5714_021851 [Onychostoma macrolepis]|uniref:Uncharacterized protein n=1 Tax=Onychostoma macrolepis TaxID=369639 RepID=A0A7J6BTK0_9TELE|nr:hypothetical protein G5714_021851 [Onychostoma macrolepis]
MDRVPQLVFAGQGGLEPKLNGVLITLGQVSPARRWRSSVVKALTRRTRVAFSGIDHGVGVRALLAISPC